MITDIHPYPAYKPSGIEWLGDVPKHWEVRRLKTVCQLAYGDSMPSQSRGDGEIPVYGSNGPVGVHTEANTEAPCIIVGRKGSFGKIHYSPRRVFAIDTTYYVDRRHSTANLAWLSRALGWARLDEVSRDSAVPGLSREDAYSRCFPLPPLPEQAAIVRYLDHADRRIRRYVGAKRKLIALLEEEKQAVINQAVTRGLDPNVRLKPCGVEWLGDVPEHWEMRRLKTIVQRIDRRSTTGSETLLSLRRDHGVVVYAEHFARPSQSRSLVGFKLVSSGQLVVNRLQANNGLVFNSTLDGLVSPDYSVFENKSPLQMQFLSDLLRTSSCRAYFRQNSTGLGTGTAGFLRLYDDTFLDTPVCLPPVSEQAAITEHLDKADDGAGAAITRARHQVELVQEYRTRLIADVVTGKLDVREAAAQLPEEDDDRDSTEKDGLLADGMEGDLSDAEASAEESVIESEVTV